MEKEKGCGFTLKELMDSFKETSEKDGYTLKIKALKSSLLSVDEIKSLGGAKELFNKVEHTLNIIHSTSHKINEKLMTKGVCMKNLLEHVLLVQREATLLYFKQLKDQLNEDKYE